MKKYYSLILLIVVGIIVMPSLAMAIDFPNPLDYDTFEDLIDAIASFLLTAALILAPIMVLIGAFFMMTAAGEPAKIKKANNIFLYTAIGLVIVMMGKGLVSVIQALMGA